MKYSLTLFKNTFDNKTHRNMEFASWDEFVKLLGELYNNEGEKGGRNSSPLISPARYVSASTRSNKNVLAWGGWACLDVDDYVVHNDSTRSPVECLTEQLQENYGRFEYLCYNTASSRPEQPKFRLVFPLTREVNSKELPHFWFAMNKQFDGLGDEQTKDLSRMYYIPAQYPNAYSFFFRNEGVKLDPDMLMNKYSFVEPQGKTFMDRLPPELQKAVMEHRKNSLDNTDITWTSYRDCPFFPRKLEQEYRAITNTGWYHKMYQIMIAIAGNAVAKGYPISATQIAQMCGELDLETGNWYENRPLNKEADRALEYIYRNG
jgi:hypothetical protein